MKGRIATSFLAGFFLCLFFGHAHAGACQAKKLAVLPVIYNHHVPIVPVTINGRKVYFGIDTGSYTTLIVPEVATSLHLPPDESNYFSHVSGTVGTFKVVNATANSLRLGAVEYKKRRITVIPINPGYRATKANYGPNIPMMGLLGADILADYDVEYDLPHHTLTLYSPGDCGRSSPPWKGKYAKMPVFVTDANIMVITVLVNGHQLTGIFDTGASVMSMTLSSAKHIGVNADMLALDALQPFSGIGGLIRKVYVHLFDSVVIGREALGPTYISIVDFPPKHEDILIGEDYMRTRRFLLSYATQTLFVQRQADEKDKD